MRRRGRFRGKRVIGLTGGVGSGKSTVLHFLAEAYGAEIIEADRVCNEIIEPGGTAHDALGELLGTQIFSPDGRPDKKEIARLIFSDPEKRKAVDALLHPATVKEVCRRIRSSEKKLVIYESALPAGAQFAKLCDAVLYVYASPETRCRRLSDGRGYSREKSEAIMAGQLSDGEFRMLCQAVIDNDGSEEAMKASAREAMEALGL